MRLFLTQFNLQNTKHKAQKHSLKENLFFRATRLSAKKHRFFSAFRSLIMLVLLSNTSYFIVAAINEDISYAIHQSSINNQDPLFQDQQTPIQDQQAKIFIAENAIVSGLEQMGNVQMIVIKAKPIVPSTKKNETAKVGKQNAKNEKPLQTARTKAIDNIKYFFIVKKSTENFISGNWSNGKNSVLVPNFLSKNVIKHFYAKLNIQLHVYLKNIYTAEFSKTAELSRFLLSRPPPMT